MKKKAEICRTMAVWMMCVVLLGCILSGCAAGKEETAEGNARNVIRNTFIPLTVKENQSYRSWTETGGQEEEPKWIRERFLPYMTDQAYEKMMETSMYEIPVLLYQSERTIELEKLELDRKEAICDFTCELKAEGEEECLKISGSLQFDEDGKKVSYYRVDQMDQIKPWIEGK